MTNESRMTFASVKQGYHASPARIVLYGVEKIGKSTMGSRAPSPIFIGNEDGFGEIESARFPSPQSWDEVKCALQELARSEHTYRTVVIDSLDWLEPMVVKHVLDRDHKAQLSDYDYGGGYNAVLDEFRNMLASLEWLREKKGMHVILIAHAQIATFKNPDGTDFNHYALALQKKVSGLVKQWADAVLFANFETIVEKDRKKDKLGKGIGVPKRVMYTAKRATFDAGNRYSLPDRMDLDWDAFEAHAFAKRDVNKIVAEVTELLSQVPEQVASQSREYLAKTRDPLKLLALRNKLQSIADETPVAAS